VDYPSNLSMFTRQGLLGLLQGAYDQSALGELTRAGQGLLSGDYGSAATNLGLLGLGMTPVGKVAKAVQKVYRAKKIGKGRYEYRGWEIEHIGKDLGETSEAGHWNLGTKDKQGSVEWHDGSQTLGDAKAKIDRWISEGLVQ